MLFRIRKPERAPGLAAVGVLALSLAPTACASRHYYDPSTRVTATPADRGLDYEAVTLASRDGTRLNAWFVPASATALATVVHFHGRSGNMSDHLRFVDWLPAEGFNVLLFDYRGFGESEGRPVPGGVHEDALAALAYVRSRTDLDPDRLLVFGQSLGGAIAIPAVAGGGSAGVRAVVTESALSSYRLVVRDHIGTMGVWRLLRRPLSWLVTDNRYSPDKFVGRLAPIPLLLIHGSDDDGIPLYHCKRLLDRAREPRLMWIVDGGRHLDAFTVHGTAYRPRLVEFFRQSLEGPEPAITASGARGRLRPAAP